MNTNLAYQEEPREELLNGKIFMMSSPSVNHYQITFNIVSAFQSYLKGKNCRAFGDGVDVYLTEEDRVIPDAMIVCNKDSIQKNGIHGTPELIVEVLSPSTAKNDKGYKKDLYESVGVREYWIVDPEKQRVMVYGFENDTVEQYDFEETVPVGIYEGFSIHMQQFISFVTGR